jgi:YidC/Oxa1 family membrane protein insertase
VGEIGYLFNLIFTYPIFNGLVLLYHLFGDFALSIIVLTLIIKLLLFPLTLKQLKSMKATQALQPQMQEIKKKYGKDQQGQAVAMQALYKEYGVNPLSGCLPLVVQLPVLYGMYYAFRTFLGTSKVADLNNIVYPFIPHFTSYPNIYLNWFAFINHSWTISLAHADPTHILPIIAGLATFIQLRMSQPKTAPGATPDPSTQSMKMMQYVMPLITVFFGWTFPAGLALYWTVSTVFQAVQQFFVTGWGSLLVTPDFKMAPATAGKSNGKVATTQSYTPRKERPRVVPTVVEADNENFSESDESDESEGAVERRSRPSGTPYNRRRQRSNSASARRRGSAQRSRG